MAEPKEETDYLLGPLFTRVSFRVHAPDTRFGETLAVCGELPEFGGWDPTQALRLQTSAETFPTWHSDTVLIGTYVASVQYKFVLISADGASVRWEETPSNRQFAPVGEELSLVEEWGRVSACPGSVHGTPEVSSLDTPMRGPAGLEGTHSLDLPPSLSEVARTARAPVLAEPLDGSERVLNVLSRLPIALSKDAASGEWRAEWEESSMWATSVDGGRSVLGSSAGVQIAYIGSPGRYIGREDQPAVAALLEKYGCYPVFIDPWDLHDAYMEYSKTTLWPLLHNELPTQNAGRGGHYRRAKEAWSAYQIVNTLFANEIKSRLTARDLVWVHGHHLLLVPERLSRECRQNNAPIGLFVHTPFPSVSIFSALPQRKVVLGAMLHASIIGFHLYEYARNFMISCRRLLGLVEPTRPTQNMSSGMLGLAWQSRQIVITVSHVGIEPSIVEQRVTSDAVAAHSRALQSALKLDGRIVLGGVEWLSSMQGTALKLTAYENLLEAYEKWRGRVTLVQVCKIVPYLMDHSKEVAAECRAIAERVRRRFGDESLHYIEVGASGADASRVSAVQVGDAEWDVNMRVAVWSLLDILVVSATRDGLNLLPFEFVSARDKLNKCGVCVLSEFAGCSRVLNGAIRVNPFSLTSIVEGIDRALSQSRGDSVLAMHKDTQFVCQNTTTSWVQLFVKDLKRVQLAETERAETGIGAAESVDGLPRVLSRAPSLALLMPRKLDVEMLVRAYRTATRRVLCFGLDGTLIPQDTVITHLKENHDFTGRGQAPSPAMLHCLRTLAADPANDVTILSGRGATDMHGILGGVHRLGLAAELGFLRRSATAASLGSRQWERHTSSLENDAWRQEAKAVMHWYTTRTNGSYSRWQESAAVWCYHDADPDFGRFQGKQLHQQLSQQLSQYPVTVAHSPSKCQVEVRIRAVNKGVTTDLLLCQAHNRNADFVLCCGDDHSDEFMFAAALARARAPLTANATAGAPARRTFNITVGHKPSRATLYVEDTRQVLFFLQALAQHAF